jgi:hypothetical protein
MSHHMHGKAGYQPTTVVRPRASAGIRLNPFPNKSPQVMPPSPRTHHEQAEQPPRTEKEKPGEHPTTKKRNPTRIFLRSCCPSQSRP